MKGAQGVIDWRGVLDKFGEGWMKGDPGSQQRIESDEEKSREVVMDAEM